MPMALMMVGGGVMLVYAAFTGDKPWNPVLQAFGYQADDQVGGGAQGVATATHDTGPPAAGPVAQPGSVPNTTPGGWPAVVSAAESYIGAGYKLGRADHVLTDCSGLTMNAWKIGAGVSLVHSAAIQYAQCYAIPRSQLVPGALIFMPLGESGIHHVAMYVGGGSMIESAPSHGGVGVVRMGYQPGPYFYGIPKAA